MKEIKESTCRKEIPRIGQTKAEWIDLRNRFEIEKNAKNQAYSFILCMGLLDDFKKWADATKGIDPMNLCRLYCGITAEREDTLKEIKNL